MIKLDNEKTKLILSRLDNWGLKENSTNLDKNTKYNEIVSIETIRTKFESNYITLETDIACDYELLCNKEKILFLNCVYDKTASDLWNDKNGVVSQEESDGITQTDNKGKVLFANYIHKRDLLKYSNPHYTIP
jgi:hypothetical protein